MRWQKDAPDRIRQGILPKALGYGGDGNVHLALSINWGANDSPVDKGQQEFKCTQCGATFSAIDMRPHPYSASFPSRCPHCQSIRTLPVSDEKRATRYESIWLLMELAEKERKEDKKEAIFEKIAANW